MAGYSIGKKGEGDNKKQFKHLATLQNRENGRKIHNFRDTAKLFTYFWGSTKNPIQWWGFHVSKRGGGTGAAPPRPLYQALDNYMIYECSLMCKFSQPSNI